MADIPSYLVDQIKGGQVILFLGAGASMGAFHPSGDSIPSTDRLTKAIADEFLGKEYRETSLAQVVELAISESSLFHVQGFIAELFQEFRPAEFHKLMPKFVWKAIATTNFDLIIERSYSNVKERVQNLVVFKKNGEPIEARLSTPDSLIYLKLHGCITDTNDVDVPLILTPDQYVTHLSGRNRLFERLQILASEFPILFVGHSLQDASVRNILLEIDESVKVRPRSYIASPKMGEIEARFWGAKKLTHIPMSFEEFLEAMDHSIPPGFRKLAVVIDAEEHSIMKQLSFPDNKKPSESLMDFLQRDAEYVHNGISSTSANPEAFYKGYFVDWAPIIENLDVGRSRTDAILSEVFLATEEEKTAKQEFYLIKGHAGSGKSVLLRRLAWDAAVSFDHLCIFLKPGAYLSYEPFLELVLAANQRIYLFVDSVSDFSDEIEQFMINAKNDNIPLTIIGAERYGEWNTSCENLEAFLTDQYEIRYLSEGEIEQLIALLEKHKSLGHMENLTFEEQKSELSKRAGRQLLVALHEATEGKPFKDIILDEYRSIGSQRAQSLYLTTCIFHRLGVPIRAGLISRVHGIRFTDFDEKLFKPLEFIVFAQSDNSIQDYVYRTRHQQIAELVFEQVLTDQQDRYDEYVRIINSMDTDYGTDREALKGLTNARRLLALFSNTGLIRGIFSTAQERFGENPMQMQQEAIFEMNSNDGSLDQAEILLQKAYKIEPYNKAIAHSLSILAQKRSKAAKSDLEKQKYRNEAIEISRKLTNERYGTSHAYHTLISVNLDEIADLLELGDEPSIERVIKQTEKTIARATQQFPGDAFVLDVEAKFHELLDNNDDAMLALKRAHDHNKRSPYIAMRLAKTYKRRGEIEEAIKVLKECLEFNPTDKDLNYNLALTLEFADDGRVDEYRHYLRNSFTIGDSNYDAQFRYARFLYLDGDLVEAQKVFSTLGEVPLDNRIKRNPKALVVENGIPVVYSGVVAKIESSYSFLVRDEYYDRIFAHRAYSEEKYWNSLRRELRVRFQLAFNYRGPFALGIEPE